MPLSRISAGSIADGTVVAADIADGAVTTAKLDTDISITNLNTTGNVVFNDAGADVDFRVEGDTDANLLFVDASTGRIGVGTNAPSGKLHISATDINQLFIQRTAGVVGTYRIAVGGSDNSLYITDIVQNANRLIIDSSGDILAQTGGGWTGSVAESSVSAVFETGSNANGTYIRYADGTQICFTPYSIDFTLPDLDGLNTYDNWTFPAVFLDENYVAYGTADGATGNILVAWGGSFSSTTAIRFRTNQNISTAVLMLLAVGRWY